MTYPPFFRTLPICFCVVALFWGIFELVASPSSMTDADLDHQIVRMLRRPDNPSRMIGPLALEEAMRDFTALGGYAILITTVIGFSVFALMELGPRTFHFFWLTAVGGFMAGVLMKRLIQRERPSVVPHLSHVAGSTSFPSSHAMMSVVVFITIGFLLAQRTHNRHLHRLLVGLPFAIAGVVGISRVCMGVHYPSDVLGGWTGGLAWTWCAFQIRGRLSRGFKESSKNST